jgi:hypothetical protein
MIICGCFFVNSKSRGSVIRTADESCVSAEEMKNGSLQNWKSVITNWKLNTGSVPLYIRGRGQ